MTDTIYEKLGPERLEQLVHNFYELVLDNPVLASLFQTDMDLVRRKQTAFLTQFLGGPPLYNQTFGHPRMRMRHMPHRITEAAAVEWLSCMNAAIQLLDIDDEFKGVLFNCFPRLAAHMVNTYDDQQ